MTIYLIKKHNLSFEAILIVQTTQVFLIKTNLGSHYSSLSSNYDQLLLNYGKEGKSAFLSSFTFGPSILCTRQQQRLHVAIIL